MEGCSMVAGVEVAERKLKMIWNKFHRKEREKIQGQLGRKKDTATVPQQQRQKFCLVF